MSLFRARGEKELLMHLIRGPLESSSSYRYPCPSGRSTQSKRYSGWANLSLLRNMLFALTGRLQLVGRRTKNCVVLRRRKQCEQGGLIYPSLCNSNKDLPFIQLHADTLSDTVKTKIVTESFCQTEWNNLPRWQVLCAVYAGCSFRYTFRKA